MPAPLGQGRLERFLGPHRGLLLACACFVAGLVAFVLATPRDANARTSDPPVTSATAPASIRRTFLADCAVCHGAHGQGTTTGPSLIGVGAASIYYWVSTGRMPLSQHHRGSRITRRPPHYPPAVQDALIRYVAALTGPGPAIPHVSTKGANVALGGELYRLNCAACHSWAGTGGALSEREAPSIRPSTPTQIAAAIRIGPEPMPVFGTAALTDAQVNDVVAYVQKLQHPNDRGGWALAHAGPLAEGAVGIIVGLGALLVVTRLIGTRT